jgi:hypothetical protein
MNKVCFFSVIFPQNLPFFNDFFFSLENQNYKDFDLVIINDGVKEIDQILLKFGSLNFKVFDFKGSISEIREFGISQVIKLGYEYIIFGDSDDFFSSNRVYETIKCLVHFPICFNELTIVNEKNEIVERNLWGDRLRSQKIIRNDFIFDKNVIGLGNSGVQVKLLLGLSIPAEILAVDWFIFNTIFGGNKAFFLSEVKTFYRQHSSNIIGNRELSMDSLKRIVDVKVQHYDCFKNIPSSFIEKFEDFKEFSSSIENSAHYIDFLKNQKKSFYWWEETNYLNEYLK